MGTRCNENNVKYINDDNMKKCLFAMAMAIAMLSAEGQVFPPPVDTILGRSDRYCYLGWYDDCQAYLVDAETDPYSDYFGYTFFALSDFVAESPDELLVKENQTDRPLMVGGLVALVLSGPQDDGLAGGNRSGYFRSYKQTDESMYLYQQDASAPQQRRLIDSVRWGQEPPRMMKLPKSALTASSTDDTKFMFCYAYEAYFDSAVVVDSTFYIAGTNRNNVLDSTGVFQYKPIVYVDVAGVMMEMICGDCREARPLLRSVDQAGTRWEPHYRRALGVAAFLPIKAVRLEVSVADEDMGQTRGRGWFGAGKQCTIMAEPHEGYRFVGWNDGVADNPRVVELERDTHFVAHFAEVVGIGPEDDGSPAFTLTPNPATDRLSVCIGREGNYRLEVFDKAGRLLEQRPVEGRDARLNVADWPIGHYTVVLYQGDRKSVKSFIKK